MRKFLPLLCLLFLSGLSCNSSKHAYNKKIRQFEKKLRKEKKTVRLAVIAGSWKDDAKFEDYSIHFVEFDPIFGYRISKLNSKLVSIKFDYKDTFRQYMLVCNSPKDSIFIVYKRPNYFDMMPRLINRRWSDYKYLLNDLRNASLLHDNEYVKSRISDDTSYYYSKSDNFYFYREAYRYKGEYSPDNAYAKQLLAYNKEGKMVSKHISQVICNVYGESEYFFKEITENEMNDIYTLARNSPTEFIEFSRAYMREMKLQLGNIEKLK
jgi:hypothetical protein